MCSNGLKEKNDSAKQQLPSPTHPTPATQSWWHMPNWAGCPLFRTLSFGPSQTLVTVSAPQDPSGRGRKPPACLPCCGKQQLRAGATAVARSVAQLLYLSFYLTGVLSVWDDMVHAKALWKVWNISQNNERTKEHYDFCGARAFHPRPVRAVRTRTSQVLSAGSRVFTQVSF